LAISQHLDYIYRQFIGIHFTIGRSNKKLIIREAALR